MNRGEASSARRRFLRYLSASPLAALSPAAFAQATDPFLIKEARAALNLADLRAVAQRSARPAHWGYLETGVLDDRTVAANEAGYRKWGIRARRLVDVSRVDLGVTLFGEAFASPVALAPVSALRAYHQDGERPVARAARSRNALQILSTLANVSIETVISDRERPVWFQLYTTSDLDIARRLVTRADTAGASAIVITIDLLAGGMRRETLAHQSRIDRDTCNQCHDRAAGFPDLVSRRAMFDRIDLKPGVGLASPSLTWDIVRRVRDWTKKRVLVKGVMTAEDADRAIAAGADGLIVSNHGGRAEESLIGTIDVLPAIAAGVNRRAPILLDGGIRRGTDAFKALALGADMVCIGRPYVWGLGSYGQEGVETAMTLIDQELRSAMQQAGATRIADLTPERVERIT
jgi:4-hydroxymandelate oxidase